MLGTIFLQSYKYHKKKVVEHIIISAYTNWTIYDQSFSQHLSVCSAFIGKVKMHHGTIKIIA